MAARPRLVRSIPFWILLVGSLASVAVGAWLVVDKITVMNAKLLDQTATGVEVYGGQAWVTVGAALIGAGLVGLVAVLFLGALKSFVPAAAAEVVEPIDWDAEPEAAAPVVAGTAYAVPAEPVVAESAAPVADEPVVVSEPAVAAEPTAAEPAVASEPETPAGYTPAPKDGPATR